MPSDEDFRALARSSPWLWRSVHLRYRGGLGEAEAWVERPGRLRLLLANGEEQLIEDDVPNVGYLALSGPSRKIEVQRPHEVTPERRSDSLVAARPKSLSLVYGDPMWGNYSWVALLDPVELSAGVSIDRISAEERAGRETWTARLAPAEGYDPTCGCCALLWTQESAASSGLRLKDSDTFPTAYEIALDRLTGIAVSARPSDPGFEDRPSLTYSVDVIDHTAWPSGA